MSSAISTDADAARTRTTSWSDPRILLDAFAGKPGLELLQGIVSGALPQAPISETMSFALVAAANGETRFRCVPGYNPQGTVHGGVAATLLDSCMGAAVMSTLDAESAYTTTQLSVSLVRPILAGVGEIFADGKVIHRGGRLVTAEGKLTDATGKLLAHGTTCCMIIPRA
jgi:uncharacterized protein (TIGR00369 family)